MAKVNERGASSERGSALWGTGGRGGDRSSVLWGKGGRGMVVSLVLVIALAAPLAATAGNGKGKNPPPVVVKSDPAPDAAGNDTSTFVAPDLTSDARQRPNAKVDVIIMASGGFQASKKVQKWLEKAAPSSDDVTNESNLSLVNGFAASVRARLVDKLASVPGLTVIPNAPIRLQGGGGAVTAALSGQLWPYESGNADMWAGDQLLYKGKLPAIAVVDSGIENRSDFGGRLLASVNLSTIPGNTSMDDQRGHGTFVAGIAAGAGSGLAGAAPTAPLVSVKVMDQNGQALTSDVINAAQWILDNKDKYNIRVANFSLHSSYSTNFYRDPLDLAVEKLWFNGVVVVAAAGNYGISNTTPSGVRYAPGNDPFVITVGAVDLGGTARGNDDKAAPWSAWGYTNDGFYKPEISAPGRYMVGPIPAGSTLAAQKASNLVGSDRIELSGTSFAAPAVAGTVAQMLARHPKWTPDQVKGALMKTARAVRFGNPRSAGLGEMTASRAAALLGTPPNANLGLSRFVTSGLPGISGLAFDMMSWASTAKANMSWNSMSWADQSWSDMSWADQSWASMSWADMSWSSMSWADMSWADMSWADLSNEDAAEGDDSSGAGYQATPEELAAAISDPDHVTVDALPAAAPVAAVTGTVSSATGDAASAASSTLTSLLP
jgi:serine protease AprX